MIKLRLAIKEDLETLALIEATCFPQAEAATLAQFEERFQAFPENFLVAIEDNQVVGMINGNTTQEPALPDIFYEQASCHQREGAYMSVFGIDVLPNYQHRGIASQLMHGYIELAKERGKKGIILTCKDHLIPFYESFGYQCLGVSDSSHGGAKWNDMLLMLGDE